MSSTSLPNTLSFFVRIIDFITNASDFGNEKTNLTNETDLYDSSAKQNKKILKAKKSRNYNSDGEKKLNIKQWHLGVFESKLF